MTHARSPRITLATLWFAGIAYAIQQTLVIPALPVLQRELHTSTVWITWVTVGFLLVSCATTPIMGRLGDQFGKKRLLLVAMGVFFLGCLGSAVAPNIAVLIACRCVQGVGGAVFPLAFAVIRDEFPPQRIGVAVGVLSSVVAVGGGAGVTMSGLVLDHLSWRILFLIAAVPAGLSVLGIHWFVSDSPARVRARVDVAGATLLAGGLAAILLALTEGNSWGWGSARVLGLAAAGLALLVAWVLVDLRVAEPMVDIRMLQRRDVFLTNVAALLSGAGLFVGFVYTPILIQQLPPVGFSASSTATALYFLPGMLLSAFSGSIGGVLSRRWGPKWPLAMWSGLGAVGLVMIAEWHDEPWQVALALLVSGIAAPGQFAAVGTLIVGLVRPTETGVAASMTIVLRVVGSVIAIQVAAAILAGDTIAGTTRPAASAFTAVFWLCAATTIATCVLAPVVTARTRARPAGS